MDIADQLLRCRDCGADFLYTIGEQEHYRRVGVRETGSPWPPPVRCKVCRQRRKARRVVDAAPHTNDWRRLETR